MPGGDGTGPIGSGPLRGRGRGFGRMRRNAGVLGVCICPECGNEEEHTRGQPCNQRKCSKCGATMARK